jgi:hypothetical protein
MTQADRDDFFEEILRPFPSATREGLEALLDALGVDTPEKMEAFGAAILNQVRDQDGAFGVTLADSVVGALKTIYFTNAAEMGSAGGVILRFREKADAALAAEASRPEPRDLGAVLEATFDGPRLEASLREGGMDAFLTNLDAQLARTDV